MVPLAITNTVVYYPYLVHTYLYSVSVVVCLLTISNIVHEGEYNYCNYCFNTDQTVLTLTAAFREIVIIEVIRFGSIDLYGTGSRIF